MKVLGAILIILGIAGFVLGSVSWTEESTVAEIGGLDIKKEETRSVTIPQIASGVAVAAGLGLIVLGSRPKNI